MNTGIYAEEAQPTAESTVEVTAEASAAPAADNLPAAEETVVPEETDAAEPAPVIETEDNTPDMPAQVAGSTDGRMTEEVPVPSETESQTPAPALTVKARSAQPRKISSDATADDIAVSGTNGSCPYVLKSNGNLIIGKDGSECTLGEIGQGPWSDGALNDQDDNILSISFSGIVNFSSNMDSMFGWPSVTSIDFSNVDDSNTSIMDYMLSSAGASLNLSNIIFPTGFGANATSMEFMIVDTALEHLELPDGFGSNATNMNGALCGNESLTSISLPAGFGSNAENMSNLFAGDTSITSLTIPDYFGVTATDMGGMFSLLEFTDEPIIEDDEPIIEDGVAVSDEGTEVGLPSLQQITLPVHFSFKGNGITDENLMAILPANTMNGKYTGKWTRNVSSNHADALTPEQLRDTYDGSTMAGTWVLEEAPATSDTVSCTIKYAANGGTGTVTNKAKPTATFDGNGEPTNYIRELKPGDRLGTLPAPASDYHTFNGWFTEKTGGTKISSDTAMPDSDVTYYAHWTRNTGDMTINLEASGNGKYLSQSAEITIELTDILNTHGALEDWINSHQNDAVINARMCYANGDVRVKAAVTLSLKPGSSYTLKDLPSGTEYSLSFSKADTACAVNGAKCVYTGEIPEGKTETVNVEAAQNTSDLTVTKKVTGNFGSKDKYFKYEISLKNLKSNTLYKIEKSKASYTANPETFTAKSDGSAVINVWLRHGEEITIKDLPVKSTYNVTENPEEYTVANTQTVEKSIRVITEEGEPDISTISRVGVILYKNGNAEKAYTLTKGDSYEYTWTGLDQAYTWTVGLDRTALPAGYNYTESAACEDKSTSVFILSKGADFPSSGAGAVSRVAVVFPNSAVKVPVVLKAALENGTTGTVKLDSANSWLAVFDNAISRYAGCSFTAVNEINGYQFYFVGIGSKDGHDVYVFKYAPSSATAVDVSDYISNGQNTEKTVSIAWSGDTEADRPQSVTVILYNPQTGESKDVVLTAEANWKYTYTAASAEQFHVSVKTVPDGYTYSFMLDADSGGYTITLTKMPPETPPSTPPETPPSTLPGAPPGG